MRFDIRRLTPAYFFISLLALGAAALALTRHGAPLHAEMIKGFAHIGDNAQGLEGFVNTCNALVNPMLIAAGAAMPLAVIGGGVLMAFGSRRGLQIVITSLASLALIGSASGIVH